VTRQIDEGDFVERLARRVGRGAHASAVFGEPVERAGVTVIPVARAVWGFGGGTGGEGANQGSGGGGGALVSPIGFIEVREGNARFVRIRDPRLTALRLAAAAGLVGWMFRRR
jgi:uncharacterized spore protein YtfJ